MSLSQLNSETIRPAFWPLCAHISTIAREYIVEIGGQVTVIAPVFEYAGFHMPISGNWRYFCLEAADTQAPVGRIRL